MVPVLLFALRCTAGRSLSVNTALRLGRRSAARPSRQRALGQLRGWQNSKQHAVGCTGALRRGGWRGVTGAGRTGAGGVGGGLAAYMPMSFLVTAQHTHGLQGCRALQEPVLCCRSAAQSVCRPLQPTKAHVNPCNSTPDAGAALQARSGALARRRGTGALRACPAGHWESEQWEMGNAGAKDADSSELACVLRNLTIRARPAR